MSTSGAERWATADIRTIPVQRFRPGQHGFAAYGSDCGQWDVVSAFVRQGLALSEKVLVILHPSVTEEELLDRIDGHTPALEAAWRRGQLGLSSMRALIAPHHGFTAARQWDRLAEESALAVREGYTAMRAYIDMAWVDDLGTNLNDVMQRERSAQHLFTGRTYSELCAYDDRSFTDEVLTEMHRTHPVNLLAAVGALRAVHHHGGNGAGVRLTGEADIATQDEFLRALQTTLGRTTPGQPLNIDLASLHFLGAGCAADLLRLSASVSSPTTVRCTSVQARVLHRLGAGSVRSLALVVEEGTGC
ncbi:MEDS domain-containing protein [Streptomyces iconiensis]|uniref:MEDS domain-containing protein n=1 Tax=Streptomyces iconiensis TaxID=1384038 RepID=A0ABT6ZRK3_9ACTN|nr:MEDS domain-containing protein [Streptomyces iconiensis]MDJ1131487.1 MEDS domain-containing protein [Streptomyces iconiensis]